MNYLQFREQWLGLGCFSIYQLRASSGNLGDIVLLEATQFNDCLEAGLIKDISAEIKNCPNLMKFDDQISTFNKGLLQISHSLLSPQ